MDWIDISAFKENKALLYLLVGRLLVAFGFGIALFLIVILAYEQTDSVTYEGLAVSIYQIVMVVSQTSLGRLADKYGRKLFILIGIVVHAVATFLIGFPDRASCYSPLGPCRASARRWKAQLLKPS